MSVPYTEHLRRDGSKMATAAARDLAAHVPTCPEWNVAKLVIHTGQHHRWVADAVAKRGKIPDKPQKPGLRGEALIEWFSAGWADLADLLDRNRDEAPAWSWSGDNRVGFWRRRTTLETVVHRWDAEHATATPSAIDPELAADGVDEMFFVMLPRSANPYNGDAEGKLRFQTIDPRRAWVLELQNDATPKAARTAADDFADSVVTASAEDMLLYLWGRKDLDVVEVSGDQSLVGSAHAWMR